MVLVRIERSGFSAYYIVSLLEMLTFGGASTESLKLVIDSFFQVDNVDFQVTAGNVTLIDYETKLFCATADGTNSNLIAYSGALTRMTDKKPWAFNIH